MAKVVIFDKDGAVRIVYAEDISIYQGKPNCLINPTFPRGVPPHLWKLDGDKIAGTPSLPPPVKQQRPLPILQITIVISILINIMLVYKMFV